MADETSREQVQRVLNEFENFRPEVRRRAYAAVSAYAWHIYATASGGAGPVAVGGGSTSTTTTYTCPACGHSGNATYT
jgi:hypothetical protein